MSRRRLLANLGGRQLTVFFFVWGWAPALMALLQALRGQPTYDHAAGFAVGLAIGTLGTITLLPKLWPTLPLHVLALAVVLVRPEWGNGVGVLLVMANAVFIVIALRARAIAR